MTEPIDAGVIERASAVKMIFLDVDGVLTDGRLHTGTGGFESRSFHVRDGLGIRLGQRAGLHFGIISGRESRVVTDRAAELYISEVHQGVHDKADCLSQVLRRVNLAGERVCYVGDDLIDLPAMRLAGLAVAPADAVPEVREAAHYVTRVDGGRGAVREVVDLVLRASGKWDQVTERYCK